MRPLDPTRPEKFYREELVRVFKREFSLHVVDPENPGFAHKLAVSDTHLSIAAWNAEHKTMAVVPVAWFFEAGESWVHELVARTVRKVLETLRGAR